MTDALAHASALCRQFEGFRAAPYLCPAGVWTVGFGSTRYPDGNKVTAHDKPVTKEAAEDFLRHELIGCMQSVLKASPKLVTNPKRLGAITDFVYNLGIGRYRASTLRVKVNEGDWPAAKRELMRWNRGGGRILPGLTRRRVAEAVLIEA